MDGTVLRGMEPPQGSLRPLTPEGRPPYGAAQLRLHALGELARNEAHVATVNHDEELRAKVAKQWSEWNHAEITPDMINCDGCRLDGAKTPYCASLCPIPRCAQNKGLDTCGDCPEKDACQDLHVIVWDNETARRNLGMA